MLSYFEFDTNFEVLFLSSVYIILGTWQQCSTFICKASDELLSLYSYLNFDFSDLNVS